MSNEWRELDADKWRDQVKSVRNIARIDYLEEWEKDGQIAYEFEKLVTEKDSEIERLKARNEFLDKVAEHEVQAFLDWRQSVGVERRTA